LPCFLGCRRFASPPPCFVLPSSLQSPSPAHVSIPSLHLKNTHRDVEHGGRECIGQWRSCSHSRRGEFLSGCRGRCSCHCSRQRGGSRIKQTSKEDIRRFVRGNGGGRLCGRHTVLEAWSVRLLVALGSSFPVLNPSNRLALLLARMCSTDSEKMERGQLDTHGSGTS
jgi:hypothetical protein